MQVKKEIPEWNSACTGGEPGKTCRADPDRSRPRKSRETWAERRRECSRASGTGRRWAASWASGRRGTGCPRPDCASFPGRCAAAAPGTTWREARASCRRSAAGQCTCRGRRGALWAPLPLGRNGCWRPRPPRPDSFGGRRGEARAGRIRPALGASGNSIGSCGIRVSRACGWEGERVCWSGSWQSRGAALWLGCSCFSARLCPWASRNLWSVPCCLLRLHFWDCSCRCLQMGNKRD